MTWVHDTWKFGYFGYPIVVPELPEINSGFASCYPKFPNKIRVSGISGSGFGLRVFCLALLSSAYRTVRCDQMIVGSGHVSPVDRAAERWSRALLAHRTVRWILAMAPSVNSRERRVHRRASLGTGQSGTPQASASMAAVGVVLRCAEGLTRRSSFGWSRLQEMAEGPFSWSFGVFKPT
jgi:hypothetical protein